jgi:hypothetical protein
MRVFGRSTFRTHGRLAIICEEILSRPDGDNNDYALAWNLIHDRRVAEDWGETWYLRYGQPISPQALRDAFTRYANDLRERYLECYADLEIQADSVVSAAASDAPGSGDLLVHVLDLWSPGSRFIWNLGVMREIGELRRIADLDTHAAEPPPAIQRALSQPGIASQRPWMESFFQAQREYLAEVDNQRRRGGTLATLNPFWVSLWQPWRERAGETAEEWCASVGLSKNPHAAQSWIAIVRYSAGAARRLICPTQLEAGWFGRHFPTPPSCSRNQGGRVVEGRREIFEQPSHEPLPEYLHAPVALSAQYWADAGFPVLRCSRQVGNPIDLKRDREAHWGGLGRKFLDLSSWMAKANGP